MQLAAALKQKAASQMEKADQIAMKRTRIPEQQILISDIYGNGWIGPETKVRDRVAYIKGQHDAAVGESIAGGPFGGSCSRPSFYVVWWHPG